MIVTEDGTITPETAADKYVLGNVVYASAANEQWPISVRLAVRNEICALLDALELYEEIERGQISGDLDGVAEEIADLTGELVAVFPACQTGAAA